MDTRERRLRVRDGSPKAEDPRSGASAQPTARSRRETPGNYTVDHTAGSYVFDSEGRLRLLVRPGNVPNLVADLKTLLSAKG